MTTLLAAAALTVFSNACYRAEFRTTPKDRSVVLSVDGHLFRLGERIGNDLVSSGGWTSFAFDERSDGLDYAYEKVLCRGTTGATVGVAKVTFAFRPTEVAYRVTATPSAPVDLGRSQEILNSLIWPVNPESFNGWTVRAKFTDGTWGMNEYVVKDGYDPKTWGANAARMDRWEIGTDACVLAFVPDPGSVVSFTRSFPPDGRQITGFVRLPRPATAGWRCAWDKPVTFGATLKVMK